MVYLVHCCACSSNAVVLSSASTYPRALDLQLTFIEIWEKLGDLVVAGLWSPDFEDMGTDSARGSRRGDLLDYDSPWSNKIGGEDSHC